MTTLESSAVLSECGTWRYRLDRRWSELERTAVFVMLNPSTADATDDDPTIRRCVSFATREGCGALTVINQFAYRCTDPKELLNVGVSTRRGPDNASTWATVLADADLVVVAWGAWFDSKPGPWFVDVPEKYCLGATRSGAPCHPLYLPADQPLEAWPVVR